MTFENSLMVELMVPREPEVTTRLQGFFDAIGWNVRPDTDEPEFIYVQPGDGLPTISYWLTTNERKVAQFTQNEDEKPSEFAKGLRLPDLHDLVEICLVVPSDETVREIYTRGGTVLEAHTHVPLQVHAGATEFRFSDPFNYSLRVTANPNYQLT